VLGCQERCKSFSVREIVCKSFLRLKDLADSKCNLSMAYCKAYFVNYAIHSRL
jgi:hypothetical protein